MKILKIFVLPLFLIAFANVSIFANSPTKKSNDLRKEIIQLVDQIDLSDMKANSESVTVEFIINVKKEIVVLNIEDSTLSAKILKLIDRKGIETEGVAINKVFVLPMVFNRK